MSFDVEKARMHAYQARHEPGFLSGDLTHACDEIEVLRELLTSRSMKLIAVEAKLQAFEAQLAAVQAFIENHPDCELQLQLQRTTKLSVVRGLASDQPGVVR